MWCDFRLEMWLFSLEEYVVLVGPSHSWTPGADPVVSAVRKHGWPAGTDNGRIAWFDLWRVFYYMMEYDRK